MAEKMNAVVFKAVGEYEYTRCPVPRIRSGTDVKIRIIGASICGTDIGILAQPPKIPAVEGIILGHECVGKVIETGAEVAGCKLAIT